MRYPPSKKEGDRYTPASSARSLEYRSRPLFTGGGGDGMRSRWRNAFTGLDIKSVLCVFDFADKKSPYNITASPSLPPTRPQARFKFKCVHYTASYARSAYVMLYTHPSTGGREKEREIYRRGGATFLRQNHQQYLYCAKLKPLTIFFSSVYPFL